jgi:cytochrome c553
MMKSSGFSIFLLLVLNIVACSSSDDPVVQQPISPSTVKAGIYDSTVVEGADDLEFVISLSSASSETVSVDYTTADGTAKAGTDYTATSGSAEFAPGEVRKFVAVSVLDSTAVSAATSRSMQLLLSNPRNASLSVDTAKGTIIDDDQMSTDQTFNHNWGTEGVFTEASECANCHESDGTIMQYTNPELSTNDISSSTQWKHTVMANSFNDPYWQAAVQDESESFPELAGFIEDKCTTCHAPMGRTHAHHQDPNVEYSFDTAKDENHAREGVSCTACHLMQEGGAFSGEYIISSTGLDIYGPYANPPTGPMNNMTTLGYTPVDSEHIESSTLCASCHTLYTPAVDPETGLPSGPNTGLPSATNGFLEQGPYLEWQNSVYATGALPIQCQDCHMPAPSDTYETPISTMGNVGNRSPYGQHTLVGGNAHLLEILRKYRNELGISGSTTDDGFNDQILLTRNFLVGAASVMVSTPAAVGNSLEFDIEVTNNAGHKIPSAYPSRRTWLHVTVKDSGDNVIFESGKPDYRGYISTDEARLKADCMSKNKLDGFDSSACYEPHRDVISDESQVAIYETVLGDINGNITHTLLQGAQYLKDNRIPPAGFTNSKAEAIESQTIPAGVAGDNDFNCVSTSEGCGKDTVHYKVDTEGKTGPYTVDARLLYQATQPAFVDGMHTDGDRVNRFKVMYDVVQPSVEVLAIVNNP